MTAEMLAKSRATAELLGLAHVEFREGLAEALPVEDGWADVVISNGVFNLCADKRAVFDEVWRVLRPGGVLQFADIANGNPVPAGGDRPDRPVDRLNCRWPAVCRLDPDAHRRGLHQRRPSARRWTPSAAPTVSPTPEPSTSTATPSSPTSRSPSADPARGLSGGGRPQRGQCLRPAPQCRLAVR